MITFAWGECDDVETGVVLRRSRPVARKPHICAAHDGCGDIQPGQRYERVVQLYEGTIYSFALCLDEADR